MTRKHNSMITSLRSRPIPLLLAWAALVMATNLCHCPGASVTFEFRPAPGVVPDYDQVHVWLLADEACAYWDKALKWQTHDKALRKTFGDLEPGDYYYLVFTGSYAERKLAKPGVFSTRLRNLELTNATTHELITIEYRPLTNFTAHYGEGQRTGRVVDVDGQPMAGQIVRLGLVCEQRKGDGLYAFDTVTTRADGTFTFTNIHPDIGAAALDEDFGFRGRLYAGEPLVITNRNLVNRRVPDIRFTDLSDGRERRFSEFAGKPVVLEFWASACGACRVPMARFETIYQRHPAWRGRIELISVSLDHELETVRRHLAEKQWCNTRQGWSGPGSWAAPAAQAMHIGSIPCVVVVDASGMIRAFGDPRSIQVENEITRWLGTE